MMYTRLTLCLTAALMWLTTNAAHAYVLTIDSSQSALNLTSAQLNYIIFTFPGVAQAGGGSTSLSGSLHVDVSAGSFQLLTGSTIVANDGGSFLPGITTGTANTTTPAPASFALTYPGSSALTGGVDDFQAAIRGFQLSVADAAPRTLAGGTIGAAGSSMTVVAGAAHLNAGNPAVSDLITYNVIDVAVGPGTYSQVGSFLTAQLPITFTAHASDSNTFNVFSGQIVASGNVPEPGALALIGMACAGLVGARRRSAR